MALAGLDANGYVLDALRQSRSNKRAALRLMRKLLKVQETAPLIMITDKLRSYSAAKAELMPGVEHRSHKGLNNRAENSHLPVRRRERRLMRFKSARQYQCFVSTHGQIPISFFSIANISLPPTTVSSAPKPPRYGAISHCPAPSENSA